MFLLDGWGASGLRAGPRSYCVRPTAVHASVFSTCIAVRGECNRFKNSNWTQPINERYLCAHPVLRTDTVARAGLGSWSRPLSYTSVQRPKENCNPDTDYEVRVIHMDIYSGLDFTVLLARARWGRLGA